MIYVVNFLIVSYKGIINQLKANEMPIEIKELHIKINVDDKASGTVAATVNEEQIMKAISESVEQAVNIEQRKKER